MRLLRATVSSLFLLAVVLLAGCSSDDESGSNGPTGPDQTACVTEVSEDITSATTWGADCDTISVTTSIRVSASLTVTEGTIILMAQDANIVVTDSGSMNAVGTETDSIVFRGADSVKGWWSGIAFETQSQDNVFEYVIIRDAGGVGYKFNNWVLTVAGESTSPGLLAIKRTTIRNCEGTAMVIRDGGHLHDTYYVTFEDIDGVPIMVAFTALPELHGSYEFSEIPSDLKYILVTRATITSLRLVTEAQIPYRFQRECEIGSGGGLYIGPGTTIEFEQNAQLESSGGVLSFTGLEDARITLTGAQKIPGYWGGLLFESLDTDNEMRYVTLEYAGADTRVNSSGVFISGNATTQGYVNMVQVHFKDIDGDGVYVRDGGIFDTTGLSFENVFGVPFADEN